MKVNNVAFTEDQQLSHVDVTLTQRELVFITKLLGDQTGYMANAVMDNGASICTMLYSDFTGKIFNRFWFDGVASASSGEPTYLED